MALVFLSVLITTCFVCIGYFHVDHNNWTEPPGFFHHGFSGVMHGAATMMFTFAGLEVVTSASEETREPSRTTPSAIMYTILITSVVYFSVSTSATLSLHLFPNATSTALPVVIGTLHIHGASSVIAVGGLIGLLASLIGLSLYFLHGYKHSNEHQIEDEEVVLYEIELQL
ncbi:SL7A1-like protein [Mya arenaria]|uniref:SL7A1-like protein n=1 Tax=Mya arenaria TaxID=6604 RepID=A0ABY7F5B3_MYAAR|nr:SL7A1-like protein [Mya arenaria]